MADTHHLARLVNATTSQLETLTDDELVELRDRTLSLLHATRAEMRHRRSAVKDRRAVERITNRASCVFCRSVFQVEHLADHQYGQHRDEIAAWFAPGVPRTRRRRLRSVS